MWKITFDVFSYIYNISPNFLFYSTNIACKTFYFIFILVIIHRDNTLGKEFSDIRSYNGNQDMQLIHLIQQALCISVINPQIPDSKNISYEYDPSEIFEN